MPRYLGGWSLLKLSRGTAEKRDRRIIRSRNGQESCVGGCGDRELTRWNDHLDGRIRIVRDTGKSDCGGAQEGNQGFDDCVEQRRRGWIRNRDFAGAAANAEDGFDLRRGKQVI